jgi:predicted nucleic acid-binding protein
MFPVFLDTNTLFSATLCDTLLRIAEERAYRPHWSTEVLDELAGALVREAGMTRAQVQHRLTQMRLAFPDAEVVGYQGLVSAMTCHPKDRHVLAAAVHARCEVLVTFNLRDFPREATGAFNIVVLSPDAFLLDQLDLYPARVGRALVQQVRDAANPPLTMGTLLGRLSRAGAPAFAEEARRHEFDAVP